MATSRSATSRSAVEPESVRDGMIHDLRELVQAIDRRLPRLKHIDEPAIAKDAAALRDQAVRLLDRLESMDETQPEATKSGTT